MTTREIIQAELDKLDEEEMDELLRVIRSLTEAKKRPVGGSKVSLISKLKQIKIEAPEDFATYFALYRSEEKQVGDTDDHKQTRPPLQAPLHSPLMERGARRAG
jgi:hypothetical protein